MLRKSSISMFISAVCASGYLAAQERIVLETVNVQENRDEVSQAVSHKEIKFKQPRDVKDLFADELDVQANNLQGNRVAMNIDGVPLPETQENKLFVSLGMDFGRGDYIEPTSLRSATVQHSGSAQGLSGSVNFATLEPSDLIHQGNSGGFVASGYDSVDRSVYGSVGGAAKNDRYEGLVIATGRFGNEIRNQGNISGEGTHRTKANPADQKSHYVLLKNAFRLNEQHKIGLTVEHQQKIKETELLSTQGTSIDMATGAQTAGFSEDKSQRSRVSLNHEFSADKGWLQGAKTQIYFQNAKNDNFRHRTSQRGFRTEIGSRQDKIFGIQSDFTSPLETATMNVLRYGFAYQYNDLRYRLDRNRAIDTANYQPSGDMTQTKINGYIEDEIALGKITLTPHLGVLHYRLSPKAGETFQQAAAEIVPFKSRKETRFLPKFSLAWKLAPLAEPYFHYSRGVKVPSSQQLSSSFGNVVAVRGRVVRQYAIVGNPELRAETADNFEIGLKGKNDQFTYRVAGYYNQYKNFIDFVAGSQGQWNPFIQYQNQDKARIYGVTAEGKWYFLPEFYLSGGVAYAKGKAENEGVKRPINTISPLKFHAGLGYEGEKFGANIALSHLHAKSDKDIAGQIYNPTRNVNLVDLGVYWKPLKQLSFTANVKNVFNKKYWNWADISYFAVQSNSASPDRTATLNADNADTYTAPGRNFNLGIRYEF